MEEYLSTLCFSGKKIIVIKPINQKLKEGIIQKNLETNLRGLNGVNRNTNS